MDTILTLLLAVITVHGYSQHGTGNLLKSEPYLSENGERLLIGSRVLGQDKEIYVGLPDGFSDTTDYPLVILLEGDTSILD